MLWEQASKRSQLLHPRTSKAADGEGTGPFPRNAARSPGASRKQVMWTVCVGGAGVGLAGDSRLGLPLGPRPPDPTSSNRVIFSSRAWPGPDMRYASSLGSDAALIQKQTVLFCPAGSPGRGAAGPLGPKALPSFTVREREGGMGGGGCSDRRGADTEPPDLLPTLAGAKATVIVCSYREERADKDVLFHLLPPSVTFPPKDLSSFLPFCTLSHLQPTQPR